MKANAEFVAKVQHVFFSAMRRGYVSPQSKKSLAELPGSKLISFETWLSGQHFLVQDLYFVSPDSPTSSGITTISCDEVAVWYMSYGGQYEKKVIPFLKEALKESYLVSDFVGGRGPKSYPSKELINCGAGLSYNNFVTKNDFTDFDGEEGIMDEHGSKLGWHKYFGGMMIPLE